VKFGPAMAMRMMWKEMINIKTMMAMYASKHQSTRTSAFDCLLDLIAVPFVDQTISIQILQWYLRRMNRRGKAIVRAWTGDF
jgi:hypothetical protein